MTTAFFHFEVQPSTRVRPRLRDFSLGLLVETLIVTTLHLEEFLDGLFDLELVGVVWTRKVYLPRCVSSIDFSLITGRRMISLAWRVMRTPRPWPPAMAR